MATGPADEADGIIKLFCRTSRVAQPIQMRQTFVDSFSDYHNKNGKLDKVQKDSNRRQIIVSRFLYKIKDVDIDVKRQL